MKTIKYLMLLIVIIAQNLFAQIGFSAGEHIENFDKSDHKNINRGIILEVYAKYNLSDEVHPVIAFTYWKSETKEINSAIVQIPSETIDSKGLKLGLDFSLFKLSNITLLLGPSISVEDITRAQSAVFGFGAEAKLKYSVWNNKIALLSTLHYKNGSELFNFGGGGFNYSFVSYMIGMEFSVWD